MILMSCLNSIYRWLVITMWADVVDLIPMLSGTNENGFPVEGEGEPRQVFANKLSVRSSEYWQAKNAGVQLSVQYEVRAIEYNNEERLAVNGDKYTIERTYNQGETTELICKRLDDDGT